MIYRASDHRAQRTELSAIHLVRGPADFTPAMPLFVTAFIDAQEAS
jgi:hypothetical protein